MALRTLGRTVTLASGVAICLPVLTISRFLILYDRFSRKRHAAAVRRAIPWKRSAWVAALPLFVLTWPLVAHAHGNDVARALLWCAWLTIAVALAELYSVCLHREAWIAAFEPWFLPEGIQPLGARPPTVSDRRLHYLVRVQLGYCVAPVSAGLILGWDIPAPVILGATLFMAKFFGHASNDYEVFYHWNLHLNVLNMPSAPRRSRVVVLLLDFFLGPLHGYVPHIYRAEHLLIHHPENSGPADVHSPSPYRRTGFLEFCAFALHTTASSLFGARIVTHRRCRRNTRRAVLAGVAIHWLVIAALLGTGRLLGVWMLFLTVHRAVSVARSQYEWHAFIDSSRPRDPIGSTIMWVYGAERWESLLNAGSDTSASPERPATATDLLPREPPRGSAADNVPVPSADWAFYDNNHLLHHLYPRAHYLDYPDLLKRRIHDIAAKGAVVMDLKALDTFAYDCWSGNIDRLSAALLAPSEADRAKFVKERLEPDPAIRSPYGALCDLAFARAADRILVKLLGKLTLVA